MNPPSCGCTVGRDEQGKSSPAGLAYRLRVTPSADLDVWRGEKAWKYATFSSGLYLFNNFYLLNFWLCWVFGVSSAFLWLWRGGLLSGWGAWASVCGGFSCCGAWAFLVLFSGCGGGWATLQLGCLGFSLQWLLLLRGTGSRALRLQ